MAIVKHSLSTRKPISILANVPRERAMNGGVTLGPRPPRARLVGPSDKIEVGGIVIERFDKGVALARQDTPDRPLDLTFSELDDLRVALDRVYEDKITKPSAPPRPTSPARPQPFDGNTTAFRQASRALVKVGS